MTGVPNKVATEYRAKTHLISLAISSSVSRLLLSMNTRKSTMATSPTMDPSVAAAIMPALEAGKQIAHQYLYFMRVRAVLSKKSSGVKIQFLLCTYR